MHGAESAGASNIAKGLDDAVVGNRRHAPPPTEERAKLARIAIVCALFLGLVGVGAFLGVRLMIEAPHRQAATTSDTANRYSRVLYTMPDGTSCRVVLFDNKSAMMSEGPVVPCDPNRKSTTYIEPKEFSWGRK
jgi:hypothetical protein